MGLCTQSPMVASWSYDAANSTFESFIWLCSDTNNFLQPPYCTFHLISYLPNIRSNTSQMFCPLSLLLLSLSTSKKLVSPPTLKRTPTHTSIHSQSPVSKGFYFWCCCLCSTSNLLKTQYDLFDSVKKIGQPLNTLKRWELRGTQQRGHSFIMMHNREAIHSLRAEGDRIAEEGGGCWQKNRCTGREQKGKRGLR